MRSSQNKRLRSFVCAVAVAIAAVIVLVMATALVSGQTIYFKKDYITDETGQIVATATPLVPDRTPPTAPTNLTASNITSSSATLQWTGSTDSGGSGLAGYKLYRGSVLVATPTGTSFGDSGLQANTSYTYSVVAYDHAGNVSASSNSVTFTTLPPQITFIAWSPTSFTDPGCAAVIFDSNIAQADFTWTFNNGQQSTETGWANGAQTCVNNQPYLEGTYVITSARNHAGGNWINTNATLTIYPPPPPPQITWITYSPTYFYAPGCLGVYFDSNIATADYGWTHNGGQDSGTEWGWPNGGCGYVAAGQSYLYGNYYIWAEKNSARSDWEYMTSSANITGP